MASETIIEARNLHRRFGDVVAVDGLNLRVSKGEIYGMVGPDGAGKSTTLRMFCGLIDPHEGSISIAGLDPGRDVHAVRDRIGYMPQRFGLYTDLTVEENLFFYADLFGMVGQDRDHLMGDLLRMTRMDPFRARLAGNLSGGMKQKLALMAALLHRPKVLFLDEPTNGVDPVSRRDFWEILYRLVREGLTVLLTTAYLDEAERCHRVGLMYEGRLIQDAPPAQIKQSIGLPCIAVRSHNQRAAREWLRAQRGVMSAEFAGQEIHAFIDTAVLSIAESQRSLPQAGTGSVTIHEIDPSLEDVFIALVRKESARGTANLGGAS